MNRRDFLRKTAATAAAGVAFPYVIPSGVLAAPGRIGANDRIKVGFIGCGGRAENLMFTENLNDHADVIAIADCYIKKCDDKLKRLPKAERVNKYNDHRKLLEKEKLDAVFVPTATHGRALICIHAMQAGLDVYAEKPHTLTIAEGRVLVNAVRKYKTVFQVGTQQRSIPASAWASKQVREGRIGKVKEVIACNFLAPEIWKSQPEQPVPDGMDWDLWCNQTELRPYHPDLYNGWAKWRDYDDGGISYGVSGWGAHAFDQVQCALGTDDTGPVEIWPEEADAEGCVKVTMRYENGTLLKAHGPRRPGYNDLGAIFIGEKGKIEIVRGSYVSDPPDLIEKGPAFRDAAIPGEVVEHVKEFFDCMRTRKQPSAHVEAAQRANSICHLICICRELKRKLKWDPKKEEFIGDEEANKLRSRPRRKGYELPEMKA